MKARDEEGVKGPGWLKNVDKISGRRSAEKQKRGQLLERWHGSLRILRH